MSISKRSFTIQQCMISHPKDFLLEHAIDWQQNQKKAYFVRYIGIDEDEIKYLNWIAILDQYSKGYFRFHQFEKQFTSEQIQRNTKVYADWEAFHKISNFSFQFENTLQVELLEQALLQIMVCYQQVFVNHTPSMQKNFGIKLLCWIEGYFKRIFSSTALPCFPKVVYHGDIKQQEFLFLYFLFLNGCDVLYLNPAQDLQGFSEPLKAVSQLYHGSFFTTVSIPDYQPHQMAAVSEHSSSIRMKIPPRTRKVSQMPQLSVSDSESKIPHKLSYEELARLSSSVVMITTYNANGECIKGGSGVVIRSDGYILTNFHVIQGGCFYGVQFENEQQECRTQNLIKYHQIYDLALLHVERNTLPLELYQGDQIVRGQQIVAIGSPLGLFNSISDGIVAGFRTIDAVNMIQFTASTSPGSSGGALLDLYGRLIGIVTGAFHTGQNLNLAVDSQTIAAFAGNFITFL